MTRALLIRHGETLWNRNRRWQGHADVPLSVEGVSQAVRLATLLRREHPSIRAVYSSDLRRAMDTARELARELGTALVVDPRWREIDVGRWTGFCSDEIRERFADEWRRIAAGEDLPRGGGETFAAFSARILRALDGLHGRHEGQLVAVVTHGGAIRTALLHVLGLPWNRFRDIEVVANTAVRELRWCNGAWRIAPRNHTAHLSSATAGPSSIEFGASRCESGSR
jgi:probable phosphoglycerate mutase